MEITKKKKAVEAPQLTDEELKAVLEQVQPWVMQEGTAWGHRHGYLERAHETLRHIFHLAEPEEVERPDEALIAAAKQYIVDSSLAFFRERGWCFQATEPLTHLFGPPMDNRGRVTRWRDSAGFDCAGFDRDGRDKDGCNRHGQRDDGRLRATDPDGVVRFYDQNEGLDEDGYGRHGYNREGVNRHGRRMDGTWVSEEAHAAFLLKDLSPEMKAVLATKLTARPAATESATV